MTEKIYTVDEIKKLINEHKEELERDFNAVNFFIFGSYARGEQTSDSDIDFLVEFKKPVGLMKHASLKSFLEKIFSKKIDVGTPNSLKKLIKQKILKEAVPV